MADRYQGNRSYRADDGYDRARSPAPSQAADGDPLAELARLIGQTDPFSTFSRDGRAAQPQAVAQDEPDAAQDDFHGAREANFDVRPGRPSWMQRVAQREVQPPESYDDPAPAVQSPVDPYGQSPAADPYQAHYQQDERYQHDGRYDQAPQGYAAADHGQEAVYGQPHADPSRYDEVLYGPSDDPHAQHRSV